MLKVIVLKGLPASGKTTWAKQFIKDNPSFKRINKDDLRDMLDNGRWTPANEKFVLRARNAVIKAALYNGSSVVVDDTNLNPIHEEVIKRMSKQYDAEVEVRLFNTPLETCIEWDKGREDSVGEQVIRQEFEKWKDQLTE